METKIWWTSKTLWLNAIGLVAMISQGITGHEVISLELQAGILAMINMVLRLVTKQPVTW